MLITYNCESSQIKKYNNFLYCNFTSILIFDVHTFWFRCAGCYNDVWGLFYIKTSGCDSNISSFCVVFLCFCLLKLPLCVCSLSKHLYLISFSACLSYMNNKLRFILVVFFKYRKALQEESKQNSNSVFFRLYMIVVGIYAGVQFFISFLMRIPACHHMTNQCDHWPFIRFVKWMRQVFLLPFLLAKLFLLYAWFSFYVLDYIFWSIVKMVTVLCPWIVFLFNILGVF